ncbi:MAG: hypothetical protein IPN17_05580, partial [Deltaproteobacteria bacterium]|nr:hypothetical protein [Deltaproteobacteria bacterium]
DLLEAGLITPEFAFAWADRKETFEARLSSGSTGMSDEKRPSRRPSKPPIAREERAAGVREERLGSVREKRRDSDRCERRGSGEPERSDRLRHDRRDSDRCERRSSRFSSDRTPQIREERVAPVRGAIRRHP